jgi:multicomponent K+:H+ antiporter subunit E
MKRILPHPVLSATLLIVWLLLVNDLGLGNILLGLIFALTIPLLTRPYWPDSPPIARPFLLIPYILLVTWDIILANIAVAKIILFMAPDRIQSRFITVPLDLKTPEAIALLSATITLTPGTVTADISTDGRALLIHSLHAPDPDAIRDDIKNRYESRLIRIFG